MNEINIINIKNIINIETKRNEYSEEVKQK